MARILIVVASGAEELETLAVADILVRAGQDVVVAGAADTWFRGSRNLPMGADIALDEVLDDTFDCVYLPGGMRQAEFCRDDPRVQRLIKAQLASGRLLAIICASPIALLPQGLAKGRQLTCFPGLRATVEPAAAAWRDEAVVVDGNLITSQGPGTAIALGLRLAERLAGEEVARTVAGQMLVPWPFASAKLV
jgi:4-methyl-5(b-hydroxyethyl)-thiazole monophosphate biosynthesis